MHSTRIVPVGVGYNEAKAPETQIECELVFHRISFRESELSAKGCFTMATCEPFGRGRASLATRVPEGRPRGGAAEGGVGRGPQGELRRGEGFCRVASAAIDAVELDHHRA